MKDVTLRPMMETAALLPFSCDLSRGTCGWRQKSTRKNWGEGGVVKTLADNSCGPFIRKIRYKKPLI
jgi:hypothetical protein